jgi:hypothetical protein
MALKSTSVVGESELSPLAFTTAISGHMISAATMPAVVPPHTTKKSLRDREESTRVLNPIPIAAIFLGLEGNKPSRVLVADVGRPVSLFLVVDSTLIDPQSTHLCSTAPQNPGKLRPLGGPLGSGPADPA